MSRLRPLAHPVTFAFDGEEVVGEAGEPVAQALVALGKMPWARSPKYHRPRGPACLRGACDGCLARVDGEPNVMTCLVPLAPGLDVKTQNTLGSRTIDLLRITDWFFPDGLNHHELFAGVIGAQAVMEVFARRVAGLGRLPDRVSDRRPSGRRRVDVLVVGAGPAGMAVACELADRGRVVEVIDEQLHVGGSLASLHEEILPGLHAVKRSFMAHLEKEALALRLRTVAGAIFGRDVLVASQGGVEILEPEVLVIAAGAHDGVLAFAGNDLPGVFSARAGARLLRAGISLGERVLLCAPHGESAFTRSVQRLLEPTGARLEIVSAAPTEASGSSRVRAVDVGTHRHDVDALLVDAPSSPAYELAQQAGAVLTHEDRGFVPREGRVDARTWIVGEAAGHAFDDRILGHAREIARAMG